MALFYKANRTGIAYDAALILRAATEPARSATGDDGSMTYYPETFGNNAAVVLDISATTGGTFDAANFWTINVQTSADGTTWTTVGSHRIGAAVAAPYRAIVPMSSFAIDQLGGASTQIFMRTRSEKTGTTAPNIDFTAYVSPII